MNSFTAVPFLSPVSCVEYGFVYFGSWSTPVSETYCLYKNARYLVVQYELRVSQNMPSQLVIPRAALAWLVHLARAPFTQHDGYEGYFDGETLKMNRGTPLNGEGLTGFMIQNVSRQMVAKVHHEQQILIGDDFMHEYLVPLMDGLKGIS